MIDKKECVIDKKKQVNIYLYNQRWKEVISDGT